MFRDGPKRRPLHKLARVRLTENNFLVVGPVKICRYIPETNTFQFHVRGTKNRTREGCDFIEVSPEDFVGRLIEVISSPMDDQPGEVGKP